MDVKIGSAPDSWGVWFPSDDKQIPWQRCLDEIAEAGYEGTELGPYGYLPTDRATLQNDLSKRGLRASGTFAMGHLEDDAAWPGLEKQVLGAGESLAYLGAEYMILIDDTYTNLWTGEATAPGKLDDEALEAAGRPDSLRGGPGQGTGSACRWSSILTPKPTWNTRTRSKGC